MPFKWEKLTWQDFAELRKKGYRSVILPVGTIEAHGVTALGTDCLIPEGIALQVADDIQALVAPTITYGITRSLLAYPGSLTVSSAAFKEYATEVLLSIASRGFDRIIVLNGHGGQVDELRDAALQVHRTTGAYVTVINWWILCADLVKKHYGGEGGHAAVDETAAVLAIDPQVVKKDQSGSIEPYWIGDGVTIYPAPSSILLAKDSVAELNFDQAKASAYFADVCQRIREFLFDLYRRWEK